MPGEPAEKAGWAITVFPASGRTKKDHRAILEAMEQIRVPGVRWPLFAWYGVDRLRRSPVKSRARDTYDRWEAYASSLDPSLDDAPLLRWLQDEILGDVARERQNEDKRFFDKAVMDTAVRATQGVANAWYDPVQGSPMVLFNTGHVASWAELSDGYHAFLSLAADIARRAIMLNEIDGADAPASERKALFSSTKSICTFTPDGSAWRSKDCARHSPGSNSSFPPTPRRF